MCVLPQVLRNNHFSSIGSQVIGVCGHWCLRQPMVGWTCRTRAFTSPVDFIFPSVSLESWMSRTVSRRCLDHLLHTRCLFRSQSHCLYTPFPAQQQSTPKTSS